MKGGAEISRGFSSRITRSSSRWSNPLPVCPAYFESAVFVIAKEQRTERPPSGARVGPAPDDELLLVEDFRSSASPACVCRCGTPRRVLRDESFPAAFERLLIQLAPVAGDDLA